MDRQQLTPQQLIEAMRQEVERALGQVVDAVNGAPEGHVIRASEHQVKDVMDALRAKVFEQVLQLKADSVESAFSPDGPGQRATPAQQGPLGAFDADGLRLDGVAAAAVARPAERAGSGADRRGAGRRRGGDQRGR